MAGDTTRPDPSRIGGFLVSIGAMKDWQVEDVLLAQRNGDPRLFGEIAIALGYVDDVALRGYVESQSEAPSALKTR